MALHILTTAQQHQKSSNSITSSSRFEPQSLPCNNSTVTLFELISAP